MSFVSVFECLQRRLLLFEIFFATSFKSTRRCVSSTFSSTRANTASGERPTTLPIHASLRRPPTSSSVSTFRRNASLNTEGSAPQAHPVPQLPGTQRI
ncbi:hypothetical protein FIBSPDRAFT_877326 [Athelia psychrophila]|uniref:Uncharacterized protein n=1 Tax=Athelia psychrophila TaxID=1759441 RepID=A0A167W2Y5_9AGAM|nr:hypothetical protein FIBSPDRAFT_877326 [Fibularhizoctonia sp. CBS 109695]